MVTARGSLWVLTCDSGCTAESRPSSGRVVRIDPHRGRIIDSVRLHGASRIAVGTNGVFVTGLFQDTVRRLDPASLRVTGRLDLTLPFEVVPGDDAFLPYDIAAPGNAVWISTARGVLARVDRRAGRVLTNVRLPPKLPGEIAAGRKAVWVAGQLAGLYRVDPATNRVVAVIPVGPRGRRLAIQDVVLGRGDVFAVGTRIGRRRVATGRNALVRIDPRSNQAEAVTSLPAAAIAVAFGDRALWVAQLDGSLIQRIDPETGEVTHELAADVDTAIVVAFGRVWTASADGTIRQVPVP